MTMYCDPDWKEDGGGGEYRMARDDNASFVSANTGDDTNEDDEEKKICVAVRRKHMTFVRKKGSQRRSRQ